MRFGYDFIIIDLELNAPNRPEEKIIELGAVRLDRQGGIHPDVFYGLVQIPEKLDPAITTLTGITDQMLRREGVSLHECMNAFEKWAKMETKNILLAGWGGDPSWLRQACEKEGIKWPFRGKTIDIKSIAIWMNSMMDRKYKSDGLGSMMKNWELKFDTCYGQRHRALPDAYNTAKLMQKFWRHYEEHAERILKSLEHIGVHRGKK